jgi:deferrochelatase/peroxidase EfeB
MTTVSNTDFRDMQGLLRFGYGKLTEACFLLLTIGNAETAAKWLGQVCVTTAELLANPPDTALQIALNSSAMQKLGVPENIQSGFSSEFLSGMSSQENRSRRLGDMGEDAPNNWLWGASGSEPDIIVMIYARAELFEQWKNDIESQIEQAGCIIQHQLQTNDMGNIEPFGFADGISSPIVDWERKRSAPKDTLQYENISMLGEFVLGYPNEYGLYTTRPLIEDAHADLPTAEDQPGVMDLGRNGTYLVFRHIEQDVHGFWQFLYQQTGENAAHAQQLAELMVGRRIDGEPLVSGTSEDIAGVGPDAKDIQLNRFTYGSDLSGYSCPLGAHIRRANPRNADLPEGTPSSLAGRLSRILAFDRLLSGSEQPIDPDRVASTRFHRILRRGREYGPRLTHQERTGPRQHNEPASGLHFICLNANIGRQFEFVQSAWLHSSNFNGLRDENDPLVGNRQTASGCPAADFTIPVKDGLRQKIRQVPRFTTIRGGAYFFLPGVRALRYLARGARPA